MKWLYLLIDFGSVIVPFLFSFHPKLQFYKQWKPFFAANAIVLVVFVLWDIYFTQQGIWGFNEQYLTGFKVYNLPIEEILFFICIPYACVFTYHCLNLFFKMDLTPTLQQYVVVALLTVLLAVGIIYLNRWYTATTFISLSLVLGFIHFVLKPKWLGQLMAIYLVLLLPFFIVNGILTGTGLPEPIVWYNDNHNLGLRMLTIPVEDTFYGFELILLNVLLYHTFQKRLFKA
jgi:lycopene cyclase domain-containing protein